MKNYVISHRVIKYEIELDESILEEYEDCSVQRFLSFTLLLSLTEDSITFRTV